MSEQRPGEPDEPTQRIETIPAPSAEHVEVQHTVVDRAPRSDMRNRGLLVAIGAAAATFLFVILLALSYGPGRNAGGTQTNVNLLGDSPTPQTDVRLNVNLTLLPTTPPTSTRIPATAPPQPTSTAFVQLPTSQPASTEPPLPTDLPIPTLALQPTLAALPPESLPTGALPTPSATPEPTAPVPQIAQPVRDESGVCQTEVSPTWSVSGPTARAGDLQIALRVQSQSISSWDTFKEALKSALGATTTREDSATRLWFERATGQPGIHHVVAAPLGTNACILQIDLSAQAVGTSTLVVRQIAESLGSAR